jgi:hypothetical protein
MRRILGLKRKGVTGNWRKLRKEQHHKLHSSPNTIVPPYSSAKLSIRMELWTLIKMKA